MKGMWFEVDAALYALCMARTVLGRYIMSSMCVDEVLAADQFLTSLCSGESFTPKVIVQGTELGSIIVLCDLRCIQYPLCQYIQGIVHTIQALPLLDTMLSNIAFDCI